MFTASKIFLSETFFFLLDCTATKIALARLMTVQFGALIGSKVSKLYPFLLHDW